MSFDRRRRRRHMCDRRAIELSKLQACIVACASVTKDPLRKKHRIKLFPLRILCLSAEQHSYPKHARKKTYVKLHAASQIFPVSPPSPFSPLPTLPPSSHRSRKWAPHVRRSASSPLLLASTQNPFCLSLPLAAETGDISVLICSPSPLSSLFAAVLAAPHPIPSPIPRLSIWQRGPKKGRRKPCQRRESSLDRPKEEEEALSPRPFFFPPFLPPRKRI